MRALVTGAGGMLGQDVGLAGVAAGLEVVPMPYPELDVTDGAATERTIVRAAPDVVINCAAWTDVDGAEHAHASAFAVNVAGAGNVAAATSAAGAWLVHISSDYVFDGSKREPYLE